MCPEDRSSSSTTNINTVPDTAANNNTPPRLELINAPAVNAIVSVKQGWQYLLCAEGQESSDAGPCDPGALAHDKEDGNQQVQKNVLLCPPDGCLRNGCSGHRVGQKDVLACGIDTATMAVGDTATLRFVVFDSWGLTAEASRTITVISPCPETKPHFCDGTCSEVGLS